MKRLLLLSLVFVSLTASAFDVPTHYLPVVKPAFSAPFIKKAYADFLTLSNAHTTCVNGVPIVTADGLTNSVSVGRNWNMAFNTNHGTFIIVVNIPANTTNFTLYNQNTWACGEVIYQTSAWLVNGTGIL